MGKATVVARFRCVIDMAPLTDSPFHNALTTHLQTPFFQWQRAGQFHHFINHIPLAWSGQSIVKCSDSISGEVGGEEEEGGELWRGREKNNYIYLFLSSLIYLNYFFSFTLCLSGSVTLYPQSWDGVSKLPPHCPSPPSPPLWYTVIVPFYTPHVVQFNLVSRTAGVKSQAEMLYDSRIPCMRLIN